MQCTTIMASDFQTQTAPVPLDRPEVVVDAASMMLPTPMLQPFAESLPSEDGKESKENGGSGSSSVTEMKKDPGRWSTEEHMLFLQGLQMYGKSWKRISEIVKTRTVVQIRTHAQKYLIKLEKAKKLGHRGVLMMDGKGVGPDGRSTTGEGDGGHGKAATKGDKASKAAAAAAVESPAGEVTVSSSSSSSLGDGDSKEGPRRKKGGRATSKATMTVDDPPAAAACDSLFEMEVESVESCMPSVPPSPQAPASAVAALLSTIQQHEQQQQLLQARQLLPLATYPYLPTQQHVPPAAAATTAAIMHHREACVLRELDMLAVHHTSSSSSHHAAAALLSSPIRPATAAAMGRLSGGLGVGLGCVDDIGGMHAHHHHHVNLDFHHALAAAACNLLRDEADVTHTHQPQPPLHPHHATNNKRPRNTSTTAPAAAGDDLASSSSAVSGTTDPFAFFPAATNPLDELLQSLGESQNRPSSAASSPSQLSPNELEELLPLGMMGVHDHDLEAAWELHAQCHASHSSLSLSSPGAASLSSWEEEAAGGRANTPSLARELLDVAAEQKGGGSGCMLPQGGLLGAPVVPGA